MKYFTYPFDENVTAITTTNEIGNMAFQLVDEDKNSVDERRKIVAKDLDLDQQHLIFVHQTHSDIIKKVTADDIGRGSFSFEEGIASDALYTKEKGLALGVFHADCVPLFFYVKSIPLVGIIHAGHKGTLLHIAYKSIRYLVDHEGIDPREIQVYIGPARRKASYYVSDEEIQKIMWAGCPIFDHYFDIVESNKFDLVCAGVAQENIKDINIDTNQDTRCFSAHKKTPHGRMASLIMLNK